MAEIITAALLIAGPIAAIGWDIYVAFFNDIPNRRDTITGKVYNWGRRLSTVPFGLGALAGHIFWPLPTEDMPPQPFAFMSLCAAGVIVGFVGVKRVHKVADEPWMPIVWHLIGIPFGHFLFPHNFGYVS